MTIDYGIDCATMAIAAEPFATKQKMRALYPELEWSNFYGDYGELIAVKAFGHTLAPRGTEGHDTIAPDGKTVQVKTRCKASAKVEFRSEADRLLVLLIDPATGGYQVVYGGDFAPAKQIARYNPRTNEHEVTLAALRKLALRRADPFSIADLRAGEPPFPKAQIHRATVMHRVDTDDAQEPLALTVAVHI